MRQHFRVMKTSLKLAAPKREKRKVPVEWRSQLVKLSLPFLLAAVVLAVRLGMGGGDGLRRVPIHGKLTAKGQPLSHATILFVPLATTRGEGGIGRTDDGGNFTLIGSRQGAKGLVPGDYRVVVRRLISKDGAVLPDDAKEADNPGCKESVPKPYPYLESTTLKATVSEVGGEVLIDIPVKVLDGK
jgi:hypothetical protein